MTRGRWAATAVGALALTILIAPSRAEAVGGRYAVDGGTVAERRVVVRALEVSSFDWSLVPARIQIHVRRSVDSAASPGEIWLDADLLDAGTFAMGVVQHEYAHQVDYFLLSDAQRQSLLAALGGDTWCDPVPVKDHDSYGCERFASTLAWAYWMSPANCMKPVRPGDESGAMPPARFRALLDALLTRPALRMSSPLRA
jgi:hypothetical protein